MNDAKKIREQALSLATSFAKYVEEHPFELVMQERPEVIKTLDKAIESLSNSSERDPFKITGRTAIGLSGGRTSAYMLYRILQSNGGMLPENVEVNFENTGKEDEKTLEFVRDIEFYWGVPVNWLEYSADEPGFKIVSFETASRNGEPFEAIIKKRQYLPNPITRFCTVELKIRTGHRFLASKGWKEDGEGWDAMIGIRADEPIRIAKIRARPSPETVHETMIAPLAEAGITKEDVGAFWKSQPFDLGLPNNNGVTYEGNCDLCFLKGGNIIQTLVSKNPERAIWWAKMEDLKLSSKPSGARFRNDRPSYKRMMEAALAQEDMFDFEDPTIGCYCGD